MPVLLDSYSETNQSGTDDAYDATNPGAGQALVLGQNATLDSIKWYLRKAASPTGNGNAKVYAVSGTPGTNGVPTGAVLATSDNFDVSTLTTSFQLITFNFSGANRINLLNGTNYAITFEYTGGSSTNKVQIGADATSPTHAGNEFFWNGSAWQADNTFDECFYLYGADATSPLVGKFMTPNTKFF